LADVEWNESHGYDRCHVVALHRTFSSAALAAEGARMNFGRQERGLLAALADVLIPRGESMPSASQADIAGRWLDTVLTARPDLTSGLRRVLDKARDRVADDVVEELRTTDPAAFGVLAEVVTGAYFMNPDVQQRIAYTGQGRHPIDPRPDYEEDGLLESVVRRGPIYRPTPELTEADSSSA
jgi:hypothetical protein